MPVLPADQEFRPGWPLAENEPPVYPSHVLGLGLPPQQIVVRVDLDENGLVAQVVPRPMPSKADPSHVADFAAAVTTAVCKWRFEPGVIRTLKEGTDVDGDGTPDYKVVESERPVQSYFDMRFTFAVRKGQGVVEVTQ